MESNMECKELFARLSDFIDGILEDSDCSEFRRHIEQCSRCFEFAESLKKTVGLSKDLPVPSIPEEFRHHLKKILKDQAS